MLGLRSSVSPYRRRMPSSAPVSSGSVTGAANDIVILPAYSQIRRRANDADAPDFLPLLICSSNSTSGSPLPEQPGYLNTSAFEPWTEDVLCMVR